jgi:hypothetical protein
MQTTVDISMICVICTVSDPHNVIPVRMLPTDTIVLIPLSKGTLVSQAQRLKYVNRGSMFQWRGRELQSFLCFTYTRKVNIFYN